MRRFSSATDVRACHILFLSASLPPETQAEIIRRMAGKGVLLVGESEHSSIGGASSDLAVEENKIRLHIARKAANARA